MMRARSLFRRLWPNKPRRDRQSRRLFMEPLEDRRLLAILGDLTGGNVTLTGDALANNLQITNLAGDVYTLSSATDNITITDNDATLVLLNNGTNNVTVTAPLAAIKNIAIDLLGAADTVQFNAMIGTAAAALTSLSVSDTGAAGSDVVRLNGNLSLDGSFSLSGVETVLLTSSVTIDTEQGDNGNAGNINFGIAIVSADAAGRDLTLNAETALGFTNGTATLGEFSNTPGPQFVRNLTTTGGTTVVLSGDVRSTNDQTYNGPVRLADSVVLTASNVIISGELDDDGNAGTTSSLTINSTGLTAFGSPVGGISPLTSLTTNVGGTTQINGGGVTTTGAQIYNDAAEIGRWGQR
jgi:hypothetical protein